MKRLLALKLWVEKLSPWGFNMAHSSFTLEAFYKAEHAEHCQVVDASFRELFPDFSAWAEASIAALQAGGKLLFFGNGGSAADAQHLATELVVRFKENRRALAAIALTTDTSVLTAVGNDLGFSYLFSRQIEALGKTGDVAIGISTSGKSPNILEALKTARSRGLTTVGLTGEAGGELAPLCDILLKIPSSTTSRIQEMHIIFGQMLCGAIEHGLELV